jgi:hypothetical protein
MRTYGGVDVLIHVFLAWALVGGEWSPSCPSHFTPGERAHVAHWIGVGPRTGLEDVERRKSCLHWDSNSDPYTVIVNHWNIPVSKVNSEYSGDGEIKASALCLRTASVV